MNIGASRDSLVEFETYVWSGIFLSPGYKIVRNSDLFFIFFSLSVIFTLHTLLPVTPPFDPPHLTARPPPGLPPGSERPSGAAAASSLMSDHVETAGSSHTSRKKQLLGSGEEHAEE